MFFKPPLWLECNLLATLFWYQVLHISFNNESDYEYVRMHVEVKGKGHFVLRRACVMGSKVSLLG